MAKKVQIIKVKDYGDDWVNRLAVVGDQFHKMESGIERAACLRFYIAKYHFELEIAGQTTLRGHQ